jgi:hypothetical protein
MFLIFHRIQKFLTRKDSDLHAKNENPQMFLHSERPMKVPRAGFKVKSLNLQKSIAGFGVKSDFDEKVE